MSETIAEIPSGTIEIRMGGQVVQIDLTVANLAVEAVERRHNAKADTLEWFTGAFLQDLAAEFRKVGIPDCTPTQARFIRDRVLVEFRKLTTDFFSTPNSPGGSN